MTNTNKNILIGLPASGKTTFIAALGYVVNSGEVPESLELRHMEDDIRHLSSIGDSWAAFEPVARTNTGSQKMISFQLAERAQEEVTEVFLPDMSGEKFRDQLVERQWESEYADMVEQASGVLLMVSSRDVSEPQTIIQANAIVMKMEEEEEGEEEGDYFTKPTKWDESKAPTAVQLVELLQFILDARSRRPPLRVSVIVSAWDTQENMDKAVACTPTEWLSKRLSLLDQFLRANSQEIEFKVFGISAQGGDYDQPQDMERMENQSRPAQRVRVYEEADSQPSHDITQPIRWLMGVSP